MWCVGFAASGRWCVRTRAVSEASRCRTARRPSTRAGQRGSGRVRGAGGGGVATVLRARSSVPARVAGRRWAGVEGPVAYEVLRARVRSFQVARVPPATVGTKGRGAEGQGARAEERGPRGEGRVSRSGFGAGLYGARAERTTAAPGRGSPSRGGARAGVLPASRGAGAGAGVGLGTRRGSLSGDQGGTKGRMRSGSEL